MLKFLGIGDAFNTIDGNTSAYMKLGSELIFIDMGESSFARAKEAGILKDVTKVHIFITHLHSDHIGSLGSMIAYLYYGMFKMDSSKICVYFPSQEIEKLLMLQGVTKNWYTFFINKWDELVIGGGKEYTEYIFEENLHTTDLDVDGKSNCYSIELSVPNVGRFYYSGDCVGFKERLKGNYEFDYIYHEVTSHDNPVVHTSYKSLLEDTKNLSKERKEKIYLMHLDEGFDKAKARKDGFSIAGD